MTDGRFCSAFDRIWGVFLWKFSPVRALRLEHSSLTVLGQQNQNKSQEWVTSAVIISFLSIYLLQYCHLCTRVFDWFDLSFSDSSILWPVRWEILKCLSCLIQWSNLQPYFTSMADNVATVLIAVKWPDACKTIKISWTLRCNLLEIIYLDFSNSPIVHRLTWLTKLNTWVAHNEEDRDNFGVSKVIWVCFSFLLWYF